MMLQELDNYDWEEAFGEGSGGNTTKDIQAFGDASDAPAHRADVERIVYMLNGENDESDWVGLFQLNDGRYLAVVAGCDYTGWDCRASNTMTVALTLSEVIQYGLSNENVLRLQDAIMAEHPEFSEPSMLADWLEDQGNQCCEILRERRQ